MPPAPLPASAPAGSGLPWLPIAAGAVLLLALAGLLFARRRRRPVEEIALAEPEPDSTPAPSPPPAAPLPPPPPEQATDRPWLDIALTVESARYSLMGMTIGYALTLSNHGAAEALDIMVHGFLGPADGDQQAALHRFFSGSAGTPLHSVAGVAPGESYRLTGELRLSPEAITPVRQGDRTLFVPLLAIDAHYRWDGQGGGQGSGRTGRAFVIGQERQPPADRLAPFRIDLGPRQYRDAASRATALLLQR